MVKVIEKRSNQVHFCLNYEKQKIFFVNVIQGKNILIQIHTYTHVCISLVILDPTTTVYNTVNKDPSTITPKTNNQNKKLKEDI